MPRHRPGSVWISLPFTMVERSIHVDWDHNFLLGICQNDGDGNSRRT
jgi:hypothetical protein